MIDFNKQTCGKVLSPNSKSSDNFVFRLSDSVADEPCADDNSHEMTLLTMLQNHVNKVYYPTTLNVYLSRRCCRQQKIKTHRLIISIW